MISARPNYAKYALQICFWCISAHSKRAETLQSHRIGQWWSGPKCHLVKNAKNVIFGRKTHHFKQNTRTSAHLISAQKDFKCIRMCSPINFKKSIPGSGISKIKWFPASVELFENYWIEKVSKIIDFWHFLMKFQWKVCKNVNLSSARSTGPKLTSVVL